MTWKLFIGAITPRRRAVATELVYGLSMTFASPQLRVKNRTSSTNCHHDAEVNPGMTCSEPNVAYGSTSGAMVRPISP